MILLVNTIVLLGTMPGALPVPAILLTSVATLTTISLSLMHGLI